MAIIYNFAICELKPLNKGTKMSNRNKNEEFGSVEFTNLYLSCSLSSKQILIKHGITIIMK